MGYWVARADWNRGFATEAGEALIDIARTLRLGGIEAAHFVDNPASGRVLEKLGFRDTGLTATRYSMWARWRSGGAADVLADRAEEEALAA